MHSMLNEKSECMGHDWVHVPSRALSGDLSDIVQSTKSGKLDVNLGR